MKDAIPIRQKASLYCRIFPKFATPNLSWLFYDA